MIRPPRSLAVLLVWLLLPGPAFGAAKGDVRIDGAVNSLDALVLERGLRGLLTLSSEQQAAADVAPMLNGASAPNGVVDTADLEVLTQALQGADLDGDGLTPRFENLLGLSPFARDTNANGIDDDDEDPDQDGLANDGEQANGFDPLDPDTDGDGILDGLEVAPPPATGVATSLADSVEFLFTGENPIQRAADLDAVDPLQRAVIRGRAVSSSSPGPSQPLAGVKVEILDQSDFGHTFTRADGMFDLVVQGGGPLVVQLARSDRMPVQRTVEPRWGEYTVLPDVVLLPHGPSTFVDPTQSTPIWVARGDPEADADGTRRATLFVKQGTTATLTIPGQSDQVRTDFTVRLKEFTVGANGPAAMPGDLPPTSAYTYALGLSLVEADQAGATQVSFSPSLPLYVENFLGLPTGATVPAGVYDKTRGAWVPAPTGRVIQIDSEDAAGAHVSPAEVDALLVAGERVELAALYDPGQTLWRTELPRFSSFDGNLPALYPPGAEAPQQDPPRGDAPDDCNAECGSLIAAETQTLREAVPVVGTPYALHYSSERVPGRADAYTIQIPLTGPTLPPNLEQVRLDVSVAGQPPAPQTFTPVPNLSVPYTWDGRDAYGRTLQGRQPIRVKIDYVYTSVAYLSSPTFGETGDGTAIAGSSARLGAALSQTWHGTIGPWDQRGSGLGGWELGVHHAYDPYSKILYLGTGQQRSTGSLPDVIATLVASAGTTPLGLELSPEGSVFYANAEGRVFRWDDGSPPATTHVAGNTLSCTETTTANPSACGDNGLAVNARLSAPRGLALAPDGSLYIADFGAARVRRVAPDGIITTVAGTGAVCTPPTSACGDGGLAKSALLNQPEDLAIAPDGTLYIGDAGGLRVRRVAPDGVISTVLGTGLNADGADGHGKTTSVQGIGGLALGPDGSLYVACDGADAKIRRLGVDGFVTTVAGGGAAPCTGTTDLCGDGGPATDAKLKFPRDVAVASDGGLLVADLGNHRIRRVSPQGLISTVAGTGAGGYTGDGGAAAAATFRNPSRVEVGPDGRLYVADMNNSVIRRVSAALPAFPIGAIVIPAEDGTELYEFDAAGRHQKTFETLSGGLRRSFAYDAEGLLAEVREWVSATEFNATTVVRNLGGDPDRIAVDAPFGQRTTLDLDPQGFVERLTNPAGEAHRFASTPGGLVTSYRPPEIADNEPGFVYTYEPATGRLTGDEDPLGETKALARSGDETSYAVTVTTPLLREREYTVERLPDGTRLRTTTTPDGLTTETTESLAAARLRTLPDGTEIELRETPSARRDLQFLAPLAGFLQARLPGGGPTFTRLHTQQATYNGAGVLTSQTDTITQNGKATVRAFDPATRVVTTTTPEGRPIVDTLDALGRLERRQVGTLHPVSFTYDTEGRLATIRQGPGGAADRVTTFAHDPVTGFLDSITDPEARVVELSQVDAAGRVTEEILPGNRTVGFSYDDNGNLISLTPPGKPAHLFRYTPLDQEEEYEPPEASPGEPRITASGYDADRALDLVTRPDGGLVDPSYEAATGRLDTLAIPGGGGLLDLAYHPVSGYVEAITTSSGENLAFGYTGPLLTSQTWTGPVAGTVAQTYSNDLQLGSETAGGGTATYLYDDDGLLERIQEGGADVMTLASDPSHGLLTGTSMGSAPNLLTTAIGYSSFGERSSDAATYGPTSLYSNTYPVRDDLGRIVQKVETLQGTTTTFDYTYDPAGRLDTVRANGTLLKDYAHDLNGNRTFEREDLGGAPIATYDAQDRLLAYGSKSFTYSEAGELETVTEAGQTTTYGYDALGALRTVTLPNATQIEYVIDGLGRRVGKRVNGVLQQGFLYGDQLRVAAELDGSGAVVSRFVYATRPNVPEYMVKAGQTYRLLTDHLGSVRLVVDVATGTVVQRIDYDAFGVVTADTNPGFQPFGFAGGLYDRDTKLVRFGARDYDSSTGRWTAKDPVRFFDGTNVFHYSSADPLNLLDPDGLESVTLQAFAGVGGRLILGFDKNGDFFFEPGVGFGLGLSASFDPQGQPLPAECDRGDNGTVAVSALASASYGRGGVSGEAFASAGFVFNTPATGYVNAGTSKNVGTGYGAAASLTINLTGFRGNSLRR